METELLQHESPTLKCCLAKMIFVPKGKKSKVKLLLVSRWSPKFHSAQFKNYYDKDFMHCTKTLSRNTSQFLVDLCLFPCEISCLFILLFQQSFTLDYFRQLTQEKKDRSSSKCQQFGDNVSSKVSYDGKKGGSKVGYKNI